MLSSSGSLVRLVPTARNSGRTRDTARTLPSVSTRAANIQGVGPRLPVLIVSDLDGTMVGNDEYTLAFRQFWESESKPSGSKIVYSTGRSFDSFAKLIEEKADVLVEPDGLICSVGTKIFQRSDTNGWVEDDGWTHKLDTNWSTELVIQAADVAIKECGAENAHFRPANEQNEHKVTVGVKDEFVDTVQKIIHEACERDGIDVKIITSGSGGWKFIDCVSSAAGKLESLEHVREQLGFGLLETVACGDSGNDILMLAGDTRCIVVGNAQSDLLHWANERLGTSRDLKERFFLATEHEALGILQGIRSFDW